MSKNPPDSMEQIRQLCRSEIDQLNRYRVSAIDAKDVAAQVAKKLDVKKISPALIYLSALEGIAQVARSELRNAHGFPDPEDGRQVDAFSEQLHDRYPIKRKEFGRNHSKYVLREDVTIDEGDNQVLPMLEKCRAAYDRHIDLFRAWNNSRKS